MDFGINYIGTKAERSGRTVHEQEIRKRIKNVRLNIIEYVPFKFNIKGISFIVKAFKKLVILPLRIILKGKRNLPYHLTSEDLSYLLNILNLKKSIVTCHDLIPLVYEKKKSWFLNWNMEGIKKADKVITVSEYSKRDISKHLGIPEFKIEVVSNAVDHSIFYPRRSKEILKKYNIPENKQIILYVGSEQKRQNLELLISSLAEIKKELPEIMFVKIGRSQDSLERKALLNHISDLGLEKNVFFAGFVEDRELPLWYNAADLFVYPCLYAGFSIPPLEAMACGTPVVTSNVTSLPEVIGNAGITINPSSKQELTEALKRILTDENLKKSLSEKGIERAKLFNWEASAKKEEEIYLGLLK